MHNMYVYIYVTHMNIYIWIYSCSYSIRRRLRLLEELRIFLRMVIGHPPEMGDFMGAFTGQPATVCILSGGS